MNLYVSNLGSMYTDDDLRGLFDAFGAVTSAKVIMDRFTNQSRGFGFVEMPDNSAALKAIGAVNGQMIEGRAVRVSEARPREERPRRDEGGFKSRW